MLELKFVDSKTKYNIAFATVSDKVVSIKGNIPEDESGFYLSRIGKKDNWDYTDYTTINKVQDDVIQFSNDGSVYEQTATVNVIWDDVDNKDGIRPDVLAMNLIKNGVAEIIEIGAVDNWTKVFTNTVRPITYAIEVNEIEGYTSVVNGTTVTYTHEVTPDPEPEVPTLEERVADIENAVLEIYDIIGE